jgi:hypothetical protein
MVEFRPLADGAYSDTFGFLPTGVAGGSRKTVFSGGDSSGSANWFAAAPPRSKLAYDGP